MSRGERWSERSRKLFTLLCSEIFLKPEDVSVPSEAQEKSIRKSAGKVTKSVSCKVNLDLRFNVIILKGHLSTFFPAP